jgi:hypothetical protein
MDSLDSQPSTSNTGGEGASFTYDQEFAAEYLENLEKYPIRKRICICGHPVNSHHFNSSAGYSCTPGNIWCRCIRPTPVYFASDARLFLRSTQGMGIKHALGTGIAALRKRGGSGEWLIPLSCSVRECLEPEITIACIDSEGRVTNKSTQSSVLLCRGHAWEMGGWRLG